MHSLTLKEENQTKAFQMNIKCCWGKKCQKHYDDHSYSKLFVELSHFFKMLKLSSFLLQKVEVVHRKRAALRSRAHRQTHAVQWMRMTRLGAHSRRWMRLVKNRILHAILSHLCRPRPTRRRRHTPRTAYGSSVVK